VRATAKNDRYARGVIVRMGPFFMNLFLCSGSDAVT